ncbi:MAG: hypothetical protein ACTHMC_02190 [Pseudobacter sp.]|uniref:hypothetical protein n=1 Tax=Pseudobacter sp. TaxID=2045420 RepID=UPI003F803B79
MRVIFTLDFEFQEKTYSSIVRVMYTGGLTEYHVRIMNSRLDRWLYDHHIFMESEGRLLPETVSCNQRVALLRNSVQEALHAWMQNQLRIIPPSERLQPGNRNYFIYPDNIKKAK